MILHTDNEWPPRRVHNASDLPRDEFGDTFSDGREIEAAHAASEIDEAPRNADVVPRGTSLLKLAVLLVAACAALVAVFA